MTVVGDNDSEPDETFTVELSNANGATIAVGTGTGTILDDDTKSGGGGGGNGGGGNCNGNKPGCSPSDVAEIEMQDPIWWFEGPGSQTGHSHDHNHDEHLPQDDLVSSTVVLLAVASSNSNSADELESFDETSETELIDLAITDLEVYRLPADLNSATTRGSSTTPVEPDESLDDELIDTDTALGELVVGLV